ncbi:MAG: ATP-binding cassette domain-containing protein [Acidobacteriota bacterium]
MALNPSLEDRVAEVRALLAESDLGQAMKRLLDLATDFSDNRGRDEAIVLSGRHTRNQDLERTGRLELESVGVDQNRIRFAALALVTKIEKQAQIEQSITPDAGETRARTARDDTAGPRSGPSRGVGRDAPPMPSAAELEQKRPHAVALTAEGLAKTYRKTGFRLGGVTFDLRQGEILGVVGPNAHGKTTLLRLLAGELRHDDGMLGYPTLRGGTGRIDWTEVKHQLAYLPQDLPRWHRSLRNTLHYEAAIHDLRATENEREVDYIVERLSLFDELDKRWRELSGGTKLRFALARALVWKPKLLILDEPLANLDFKAQQTLLQDVRHLASSVRHPMAVVISSQHLHEVEAVADRILFLHLGRVRFEGPREAIGEQRDDNVFELGVPLTLSALHDLLDDLPVHEVSHSGISYIVRASLGTTAADLLGRLFAAGVAVDYFRDVSRSTKALFEQGGEVDEPAEPRR